MALYRRNASRGYFMFERSILSQTLYRCGLFAIATSLMGTGSAQVLEEIIVTATKREEALTDVPISISAIDTEKLIANGWNETTDVLDFVPNVTFYQNGTSTTKLNIRGVHSDGPNPSLEAPVAIFTDGIYNPRPDFVRAPLLDLEGVEVQRGPQATYYGHNATAGSISFRSTRQSLDAADGFLVVEGSAESRNKVDFAYGAPLSDSFGLRFSGAIRNTKGHIENIAQNRAEPEGDSSIFRLSGMWVPGDQTDIFFKVERYESDLTGEIREPITCGGAGNPTAPAPCRAFDPSASGSLVGQADAALGVDDRIAEGATILPNYTTRIFGMGSNVTSTISDLADALFMSQSGSFSDNTRAALRSLREQLHSATGLATTLGYGPRFLHSTGQLHKGDSGAGLFIQLSANSGKPLSIPGEGGLGFDVLFQAQELGDREALLAQGRRVLRLHLGGHANEGLRVIANAIQKLP